MKGVVNLALFRVCRGNESNLPATMNDGWAYFCTDTGNFYIDWADDQGALYRVQINSNYSNSLRYHNDGELLEISGEEIAEKLNSIDDAFMNARSDWDQTDETAVDYIKNKPEIATDDEIIEMLAQEDVLPVVADADGSILADENSNILLW